MNQETIVRTQQLKKKQRIKSRLQKVVMILACVVVFCTTYALILPAITTPTETFCGMEEHVHTVDCYKQLSQKEPVLVCDLQRLGIHSHGPACWDQNHKIICGQADYVAHSHDSSCYDLLGGLACQLAEKTTHAHTEQCYHLEFSEQSHTHGDDCYAVKEQTLTCIEPETEGHSHGAECFVPGETLLCTETAPEHAHVDGCYEQILQCTAEETAGHSHGDACYTVTKELICELDAGSSFEDAGTMVLVCNEIVAQTHVHGDDCFEKPLQILTCTLAEDGHHIHSELCYGIWELQCDKEEHVHENACYADLKSDLEYPSDWEKTFAEVELRGMWQQDVLSIARTQLGYAESDKNYIVTETGVRKGYTRYGEWYGDPYGDWCAMFVSFCMHYGGVEGIPMNAGCTPWIRELREMNLFREQGTYRPESGDIIFFDWEGDGKSDHVGLVSELKDATADHPAELITLEGNASNRVRYVSYDPKDVRIVGYGQLSRNRLVRTYCGLDEHTHDAACYDADTLICTLEEHLHNEDCNSYKVVYYDNLLRAFAYIEGVADLPQDLSMKVTMVDPEKDPKEYDSLSVALNEEMASLPDFIGDSVFYSIRLFSQGEAYELPEGATVRVEMSFHQPVFSAEQVENANGAYTYLITPDPEAAEPETEEVDEEATEETAEEVTEETTEETTEEVAEEVTEETTEEEKAPTKRQPGLISDTEEPSEPTGETEAPIELEDSVPTYQARPAEGEQILDLNSGITGINFRAGEIGTVALALTRETVTGTFWQRLFSTDEIESGGTYMIISAEGNYALRGNRYSNYKAVTLTSIKGNETYYTITDSDDTLLRWKITKSGSNYIVRNQGASINLRLSSSTFLYNSSSATNVITYIPTEKVFRFNSGSYYLRNTGSGSFTRSNDDDGEYSDESDVTYYFTRDMLIFKLSDVTSLEVPEDITGVNTGSGSSINAPEKPDYPEFITPSGGKTGDTSLTDPKDGTISVDGKYYSDPATSDIEREYREDSVAESERNDGKVLADKSVIYGDDDYGAFDSYDQNTFGVTLSTLGQEYKIPYEYNVQTPVDVVFILDVSGSMKDKVDPKNTNSQSRAQAMVAAVNSAFAEILNKHDANRVGLAIYSGGAWELLPLDRYKATNNEYLICQVVEDVLHENAQIEIDRHNVLGGPTLKNESDEDFSNVGKKAEQGLGTYTQAGIAIGRKIFNDVGDDIYYTETVEVAGQERKHTVTRQPVFILLSDGEPTYSTNVYMDPLNGPHYGDGMSTIENAKGINGYYTVLTANYCKRMVSIQYEKPALFYTVGMGIFTPEQGDGPNNSESSETGDNYKRAVLNPTVENVTKLTSTLNAADSTEMFKSLMQGKYSGQSVTLESNWPDTWTGVPHEKLPILQGNPYADDYSYADGAYFGNITSEELAEIFSEIIKNSLRASPYGFVLFENTSITLRDELGNGMEIKGTPVLRYNGINYSEPSITVSGSSTIYTYSATHTDPYIPDRQVNLSEILVMVTENNDGTQVVEMYVPENLLPTYTPETIGMEYYYEMLPVRLIYQVGLTQAAKEQVLALNQTGGEVTFYTNKWMEPDERATSTLVPSSINPFYNDTDDNDGILPAYEAYTDAKTENITGTLEFSVDSVMGPIPRLDNKTGIVETLGNNGKLVFQVEATEIPVEKKWEGVVADIMNPVVFQLYRVTETISEEGTVVANGTLVGERTLDANNAWMEVFSGVAVPDDENTYYVIVEPTVSGFQTFYRGTLTTFTYENAPVTGVKVDLDAVLTDPIRITNMPTQELVETGGSGTFMYTLGGCFLIAAAGIALMYIQLGKGRKGGKAHS